MRGEVLREEGGVRGEVQVHVIYVRGSTFNQGRNHLYLEALRRGTYDYFIFLVRGKSLALAWEYAAMLARNASCLVRMRRRVLSRECDELCEGACLTQKARPPCGTCLLTFARLFAHLARTLDHLPRTPARLRARVAHMTWTGGRHVAG